MDCLQQTLFVRMSTQMIAIETKQNELDAKFASMLDSQHAHT